MEFIVELDGKASVDFTLSIAYRNSKIVSTLREFFGKPVMQWGRVAKLDDITQTKKGKSMILFYVARIFDL